MFWHDRRKRQRIHGPQNPYTGTKQSELDEPLLRHNELKFCNMCANKNLLLTEKWDTELNKKITKRTVLCMVLRYGQ